MPRMTRCCWAEPEAVFHSVGERSFRKDWKTRPPQTLFAVIRIENVDNEMAKNAEPWRESPFQLMSFRPQQLGPNESDIPQTRADTDNK